MELEHIYAASRSVSLKESIAAALSGDLADAMPELVRLADLEGRLLRLDILSLERLAERDGKSVGAVLARDLLDVVYAHSHYLATAIPAFTQAFRRSQGIRREDPSAEAWPRVFSTWPASNS